MTDRELLELAAKAAGYDVVFVHDNKIPMRRDVPNRKGMKVWNPLEDDGDALRLAARVGISISFDEITDAEPHGVSAAWLGSEEDGGVFEFQQFRRDRESATRRAIVRAAAEIGRTMK